MSTPAPSRVLLVKTSSMGDVVHNLPVASDLAAHFPGLVIDWVVEESFADLPALHPAVTRVIPIALRRWRKHPWARGTRAEVRRAIHDLRRSAYDAILDTQGLVKSAIIARIARGPAWGERFQAAREPLAALLYRRHAPPGPRPVGAIARNRHLASVLFGYPLPEGPPNAGLSTNAPTSSEVLCLLNTSRPEKHWPLADWAAVARALVARGLQPVVPAAPGGSCQDSDIRALAAQCDGVLCLPAQSLRTLAPRLARARLVIGVDTGLLHLGAAFGRPAIGIFTGTDPARYGVTGSGAPTLNLGDARHGPSAAAVIAAIDGMLGHDTAP